MRCGHSNVIGGFFVMEMRVKQGFSEVLSVFVLKIDP